MYNYEADSFFFASQTDIPLAQNVTDCIVEWF